MIERIDVVPGNCSGTKWVVVNDDRKHPLTKYCVNYQETMDAMLAVHVAMAEQWANSPTRKSAIVERGDDAPRKPSISPDLMFTEVLTRAGASMDTDQASVGVGMDAETLTLKDGRIVRMTMKVEVFLDQGALDAYDDATHGNGGY